MIETVSVANAEDTNKRSDTLYGAGAYKNPMIQRDTNIKDLDNKNSPFYIRQKIEIGVVATVIANRTVKILIMIVLMTYMYGAICLKYVSGAESFDSGVSYTFWGNDEGFEEALGFDPYYIGICLFGSLSIYFSFGNIENAKTLQMVTTILRFLVTLLMCSGSIYYWKENGSHTVDLFNWKDQMPYLAEVFGNTTFAFIYHHSISGIITPVRP